jgi:hypothetical protein
VNVAAPVRAALGFQRDAGATSPLYRIVLDAVVADVDRGGPCAAVLGHADPSLEPIADAVTLRFLGGVHRIVLDGRAPELALHYPSAGGRFDADAPAAAIGDAFIATVEAHRDEVIAALGKSVQTNEVGRSAVLLPGYLTVSRETGLPLRVLEIGASGGLNLRWDRYRYEGGASGSAWGDTASPLRFTDRYVDPRPELDIDATVLERRGCDAQPIDVTTDDGRLALRSFVWPDQTDRFAVLDSALAIAGATPAVVDRADAGAWLDEQLRSPIGGVATVVVHSIVWQYLPSTTRRQVRARLHAAGAVATADAPITWLRMEPGEDPVKSAEVRLMSWPGGSDRLLARAGYHGRPIRMSAGPSTR